MATNYGGVMPGGGQIQLAADIGNGITSNGGSANLLAFRNLQLYKSNGVGNPSIVNTGGGQLDMQFFYNCSVNYTAAGGK